MLSLASRYAQSIFEISSKYSIEEKVLKELSTFRDLVKKDKLIFEVWHSKTLTTYDKYTLIIEPLNFSQITKEFLKLLCLKKREKLLDLIIYYYEKNYEKKANIFKADLILAKKIDDLLLNELINNLERIIRKKIIIDKIEINPEIIGGFVLISDDNILDYSIKTNLDKLIKEINLNVENFLFKANIFATINYNLN